MRFSVLLLVSLAATNCIAQSDPCSLVGGKGSLTPNGGGHNCSGTEATVFSPGHAAIVGIEPRLLAMQIDHLKTISQNQQQLTAAVQALADATTQLSKASNSLLESNTAWRKDVLDKAIAQISAVPAALAQNKELVDTLTEILSDRLARETTQGNQPTDKR